ncbi:alpha/beta hydrolase [Spongiactinospora sp. TRM90649]|uniref:alpha/beta fold hydrolase n=1 Tax=Spongiactinospora sp. TRM90649 TaxID=3031114 RepID=UPI0023FA1E8E|nr:alpha/beta hydrolase [Spongiactinospora sp. TRM90649]MDF5754510.1 alpha/beta hydrolase [Spongiactinospora sp. TRM90649]
MEHNTSIVEVNGVPTWYASWGTGEPVVLMHGGFSDSRDFTGGPEVLAGRHGFRVLTPDRRGHGRTADVEGPITHELMAQDMIAFIERVAGGPVHLVGYSDGGTVALLVALRRPDLVRRLVLISASYSLDGLIIKPEPGGEMPPPVAAAYGEVSPDGIEHFPVVVAKRMAEVEAGEDPIGPAELGTIPCRTLVLSGDDDLVRLEHTIDIYRRIPDSELGVVPGTSHVLLAEKPELCTHLIVEFLRYDPVPTYIPIRRAT